MICIDVKAGSNMEIPWRASTWDRGSQHGSGSKLLLCSAGSERRPTQSRPTTRCSGCCKKGPTVASWQLNYAKLEGFGISQKILTLEFYHVIYFWTAREVGPPISFSWIGYRNQSLIPSRPQLPLGWPLVTSENLTGKRGGLSVLELRKRRVQSRESAR